MKKLPVEVDVTELLVNIALMVGVADLTKEIGGNCLIAFYYLLVIGE